MNINHLKEKKRISLKSALLSQENISDIEALKINYALQVLRNEGIKTLLLTLFFAIIGQLPAFLLCMGILCTVRVFSGGIHMHSNIGCFLTSLIYLCLEILVLPTLGFPDNWYKLGLPVSILFICLLSPIPSYKRPIKSQKKYIYCKTLSIIFSITWGVILVNLNNYPNLINCGMWVLMIQATELVCQKINQFSTSLKNQRKAGIYNV